MRFLPLFSILLACGPDSVALDSQSFSEFDGWGLGIEGFNPNNGLPSDTGGNNNGFSQYDGIYFGKYQLAVSYSGSNCSFSEVSLVINILDGEVTGGGDDATTDCGVMAGLDFDGTVKEDTSITGMFYEETGFIFEGEWTGFVSGGTELAQISGSFNQSITSINPGGLVTVSGSFIANQ